MSEPITVTVGQVIILGFQSMMECPNDPTHETTIDIPRGLICPECGVKCQPRHLLEVDQATLDRVIAAYQEQG